MKRLLKNELIDWLENHEEWLNQIASCIEYTGGEILFNTPASFENETTFYGEVFTNSGVYMNSEVYIQDVLFFNESYIDYTMPDINVDKKEKKNLINFHNNKIYATFNTKTGAADFIDEDGGTLSSESNYALELSINGNNTKYSLGVGCEGIYIDSQENDTGNFTIVNIGKYGIYINDTLKMNRYIHNIFISGVARNKNINVSFQVYGTNNTEATSISRLVDLIGKNMKIAVSGYHEDLGVIIAGVTVNSNNELTFVGVNSSATSIAWSEISDVSITDSIQQL